MLVPALERDQVLLIIHVRDGHILSAQPTTDAIPVQPQPDQVTVHAGHAVILLVHVPVERHIVTEPFALQEFLSLKDHRDAGRGEQQPGRQRRALLGMPARRIIVVDLLRNARLAIGHLIV